MDRKPPISAWTFNLKDTQHRVNLVDDTGGPNNAYPGSGLPCDSNEEFVSFMELASGLANKDNPCMIELGCHWALSSIMFRKLYPKGKSIILEPDLCSLGIGRMNFHLNNIYSDPIWGCIFPMDPSIDSFDSGFTPDLNPRAKEIDFIEEIYKKYNLKNIDMLHMDIQGSETPLINYLDQNNFFDSIIKAVFIATHNIKEHHEIVEILKKNNFNISLQQERTLLPNKPWRREYVGGILVKESAYKFAQERGLEVIERGGSFIVNGHDLTDGLISAYKNE